MNDRMKNFYMGIAKECAKMSRAVRLQVGCVVVKNNNIISFSWNGMPSGWDNTCEDEIIEDGWPGLKTKLEVLHAESNAISKLAQSSESGKNAVLFITHSPCIECAKLIYQSGIKTVYYDKDYRSTQGIDFLQKSNVEVIKLNHSSPYI